MAILFVQFIQVVVPMRTESQSISNQSAYHGAGGTICNIHSLISFLSPHLYKLVILSSRNTSYVRRTRKTARLVSSHHSSRRHHLTANDPNPARVRARSYFPARQGARHQRAGFDLSYSSG